MIIQFDVDGVLADFMGHACKVAQSIDSSVPTVDTYTTKDWDNWEGWSQDVKRQVWTYIKNPSNLFFFTCPSLINREDWMTLRRLNQMNDVYFVTSRPGESAKRQTEAWLYDRLEQNSTVIITSDKAGFAKLLQPNYTIEDNAINAAKIGQVIGVHRSFLMDRLYNQTLHPRSATRITKIKEFFDALK